MSKQLKFKRKGTLHVIAGLMLVSVVLRVGSGAGAAFAENIESAPQVESAQMDPAPLDKEKDAFLTALLEREERLDAREEALEARLSAMEDAKAQINEQLAKLEAAEEALSATIAMAETAAEDDLARLTAVYENMKPKDAAALFEEMTPEFSAGFLGRMRPDAAALIMTLLEPQTAYTISVVLAGRNANVPTE